MILFILKLCITAFIIMSVAYGLDKLIEPIDIWERQHEKIVKAHELLNQIGFYSFITGIALGVIFLLMIVWFI